MALEDEVLFEKDDKGIATVILNCPDSRAQLDKGRCEVKYHKRGEEVINLRYRLLRGRSKFY